MRTRRMPSGIASLLLASVGFASIGLAPWRARGAELRAAEGPVVVPAGEVLADDLYAAGETVQLEGTVQGDAVLAGRRIEVKGLVRDDVLAAGAEVVIEGRVLGSVRAVGGDVVVRGLVSGDVAAGGGEVRLEPGASIGGDVLAGGGTVVVQAPVGGGVVAGASMLTLDGAVGEGVRAEVGALTVGPNAQLAGPLRYEARQPARIDPAARLAAVEAIEAPAEGRPALLRALFAALRDFVGLALFGLLLLAAIPGGARRAAVAVSSRGPASLAFGAVVLLVAPLLAVMAFGVGAVVGGWWIGGVILASALVLLAAGMPVAATVLGRKLLGRWRDEVRPAQALLVGAAVLVAVSAVPGLGGLLLVLAACTGAGALLIAAGESQSPPRGQRRAVRRERVVATPSVGAPVAAGPGPLPPREPLEPPGPPQLP